MSTQGSPHHEARATAKLPAREHAINARIDDLGAATRRWSAVIGHIQGEDASVRARHTVHTGDDAEYESTEVESRSRTRGAISISAHEAVVRLHVEGLTEELAVERMAQLMGALLGASAQAHDTHDTPVPAQAPASAGAREIAILTERIVATRTAPPTLRVRAINDAARRAPWDADEQRQASLRALIVSEGLSLVSTCTAAHARHTIDALASLDTGADIEQAVHETIAARKAAPIEQALLALGAARLWLGASARATDTAMQRVRAIISTLAGPAGTNATHEQRDQALALVRKVIERLGEPCDDAATQHLQIIENTLAQAPERTIGAIAAPHNAALRVCALRHRARGAPGEGPERWGQILNILARTDEPKIAIAHAMRTWDGIVFEAREAQWLIQGAQALHTSEARALDKRAETIAQRLRWRIAGAPREARTHTAERFLKALHRPSSR